MQGCGDDLSENGTVADGGVDKIHAQLSAAGGGPSPDREMDPQLPGCPVKRIAP